MKVRIYPKGLTLDSPQSRPRHGQRGMIYMAANGIQKETNSR